MAEETKNEQLEDVQQADEQTVQEKTQENEPQQVLSDDEKAEIEEFRKWKESHKSETEKHMNAVNKAEKARIDAETRASDFEAKFMAVKNGVSAESVDDVIALAKIKTDKNTTLEQAILKVIEKYPQFLGRASTTGVKTNNNGSCQLSGVEKAFLAKNPNLKF